MAEITPEQISIIFEASLIFLIAVFLLLIFIKYKKGKSKLKLLVFWIFLFIFLAFLGVLGSRLTYDLFDAENYPNLIIRWFLLQIGWYRFSFALIIACAFFSYLLKEAIFDSERKKGWFTFITIFGLGGVIFTLVTPTTENDTIFHLGGFLIVFIYIFIVYIEFITKSIKLYRHIEKSNKTYRTAILSLVIMAFSFIFAILMFVLDFILKAVEILSDFSVFYYLADVSILLGIIFAYFGYVRPKT